MPINMGGLLGLLWARDRQEREAAERLLGTLLGDLDGLYEEIQDVVVDHRDLALRRLSPEIRTKIRENPIGSAAHSAALKAGFRTWARADRSVLAGHERTLRDIKLSLLVLPGREHLNASGLADVGARIDDIVGVVEPWLSFFEAVLSGPASEISPRWDDANMRWTRHQQGWVPTEALMARF